HSWCYGHIAYQTAWLKANYPVEYMTALLRLTHSAPDPHARIAAAVAECTRLEIPVLLPDVNRSEVNFSIERGEDGTEAIRFGLGIPKNVGNAAAAGMVAGRSTPRDEESEEPGGPYADLEEFLLRADLSATNARALEHLIKAGA